MGLFIFGKFLWGFTEVCAGRDGGLIPGKSYAYFLCISSSVRAVMCIWFSIEGTRYVVFITHLSISIYYKGTSDRP